MSIFLSVIIPILTPRESIDRVIDNIESAVSQASISTQVVVIGTHHERAHSSCLSKSSPITIDDVSLSLGNQAYVLNQGLARAQGEWVMILCPDSQVSEHVFAKRLESLLHNKYDVVAFNHGYALDAHEQQDETHASLQSKFKSLDALKLFDNVNGVLIRKSVLINNTICFNELLHDAHQHQDFLMRVFIHSRVWLLAPNSEITLTHMHEIPQKITYESISALFETKMLLMYALHLDLKVIHEEVWIFTQILHRHVFNELADAPFKQKIQVLKSHLHFHGICTKMIESYFIKYILKRPWKLPQWVLLLHSMQEKETP